MEVFSRLSVISGQFQAGFECAASTEQCIEGCFKDGSAGLIRIHQGLKPSPSLAIFGTTEVVP
jgi:hypothetical protein